MQIKLPLSCQCATCEPFDWTTPRMIVCQVCGDKRCAGATDHRNKCSTGINRSLDELDSSVVVAKEQFRKMAKAHFLDDIESVRASGNYRGTTLGDLSNEQPELSIIEQSIDSLGLGGPITCAWTHNEDIRIAILNHLLPGWNALVNHIEENTSGMPEVEEW